MYNLKKQNNKNTMVEGVMSLHVWLSHNQNDQMMSESLLIQRQSEEISLNKMPPTPPSVTEYSSLMKRWAVITY